MDDKYLRYTLIMLITGLFSGYSLAQTTIHSETPSRTNPAELIDNASTLIKQKRYKQAKAIFQLINPQTLPAETRLTYLLKKTQLYLANHQAKQALSTLQQLSPQRLTANNKRQYYELKASAYSQVNNVFETIKTRISLGDWLVSADEIKRNQAIIWNEVGQLSKPALRELNPNIPGDPTSAWMALALIYKTHEKHPEQLQDQLKQWQKAFPQTLSIDTLPYEIQSALSKRFWKINKIALLLPSTGPYKEAAKAIKQGVLTAYYQSMGARPTLEIYDTNSGKQAYSVYQQAIKEGANLIIGPLSKHAVQSLQYQKISIPTLALNKPGTKPNTPYPRDLYYFSLSPTYEAEQAADRAWQEGYQNAIMLTPNTVHGKSIATAFKTRWQKLGGQIKNSMVFSSPQAIHYGLSSLLKVRQSQDRYRKLSRLLESPLQFQPRPRKDIDFLFFAARNQEAMQIKPLLRFYFADKLPVISLSNAYTGNTAVNSDLDDIKIMITPWSLANNNKLQQQLNYASQIWNNTLRNNNLFALGLDVYDLAMHINRIQNHPNYVMRGMTGTLSLSRHNIIRPHLTWVTYKNGKVQTLVQPGILSSRAY
ncbi:penicillin-binding protein activator [Piscirickettsia litoralis]|uniref:LppC family lipoprotein n=1 Tax=Piscirickettsia litoralis TaxID=1891921 RepID=A0ABX3A205_9GAMM|nr:penicillin-binding protein activator [Piscirickettsia litoralis]ODN42669.1 LppC family lipoprotein [Piscirickettsia litoralis]